jgi:hypothetical protein
MAIFLIACTSKEDITPASIVGKWSPTYITQTRQADGTFDAWHRINTFAPLPVYEFTSDRRFLKDGKSGASCCLSGSKYTIAGNSITFAETLSCPNVDCKPCSDWKVDSIKSDTLVLDECFTRNKYVKLK